MLIKNEADRKKFLEWALEGVIEGGIPENFSVVSSSGRMKVQRKLLRKLGAAAITIESSTNAGELRGALLLLAEHPGFLARRNQILADIETKSMTPRKWLDKLNLDKGPKSRRKHTQADEERWRGIASTHKGKSAAEIARIIIAKGKKSGQPEKVSARTIRRVIAKL